MSNYQAQFDSHVADANSAVSNNTTALEAAFFDMHPAHIRRLLSNISALLSKVDLGRVNHPEHLATTSDNAAQRAVNYVSAIRGSFDAGPVGFINSILPGLVEVEAQLSRAIGVEAFNTKTIKNVQLKAINQALDRATGQQLAIQNKQAAVDKVAAEIEELGEQTRTLTAAADTDRKRTGEIRALAEKLAKGNASQNPLEKLVREARDRFDEIAGIIKRSETGATSAAGAADRALEREKTVQAIIDRLEETDEQAKGILQNATQAGLAAAYKLERDRLAKEQNRFALVFFGGVLSIVIYAAVFILPLFSRILENDSQATVKIGESTLLLIVRLVIIAPVVWALIFTNKRHSNLEILQMDYAAKAATALAYSGYKQEMDDDDQLGDKLRDGLVVRFVEHPERLLNKNRITEQVGFDKDGLRYSSVVTPPGRSSKSETHADRSDEGSDSSG